MARVVKAPDERRDELTRAALGLFLEQGYDATSVEQITNAAGVAKGTFYNYFDGKQDLLAQMAGRLADRLLGAVGEALHGVEGGAAQRLSEFLRLSSEYKLGHYDEALGVGLSLYRDENAALRRSFMDGWFEQTRPLVIGIVAEGAADGEFDVADAEAATEIILSLWYDYGDRIGRAMYGPDAPEDGEVALERTMRRYRELQRAQEKILGVAPGALGDVDDLAARLRSVSLAQTTAPVPERT